MERKQWTKEEIRNLILTRQDALERAILAIHARQTTDEQREDTTKHSNGRGFNSPDARRGSYYARWIKLGRHLTGNHIVKARAMMQKYVGQLVIVANQKT